MKYFSVFFIIFILLITGCKSIPEMSKENATNIKKTGFLDNNHFQIIISAKPDKKLNGLVAKRENAITKARNKFQQTIYTEILNNVLDLKSKKAKKNFDYNNVPIDFKEKIYYFFKYGYTEAEYFDKRNNAYIIYRIKKKELNKSFISLKKQYYLTRGKK